MNAEKLIALVYERRSLWDMMDKKYHMRHVQRKLWAEVAVEINAKSDEVKKRWRGLRDTFRKELMKTFRQKSADGSTSQGSSTWPYYKLLLFLTDTMKRRKLKGNMSSTRDRKSSDDDSESRDDAFFTEFIDTQQLKSEGVPEMQELTADEQPIRTSRQSSKAVDEQYIAIEKAQLRALQNNDEQRADSDYQFLISLLPYLKGVPYNRKMIVRTKLQQVFIDEEELRSQTINSSCQSSCSLLQSTETLPQVRPTVFIKPETVDDPFFQNLTNSDPMI